MSNIHSKNVKELMKKENLNFWDALQLYITTRLPKETVQEKREIRQKLESEYIFSDLEL